MSDNGHYVEWDRVNVLETYYTMKIGGSEQVQCVHTFHPHTCTMYIMFYNACPKNV